MEKWYIIACRGRVTTHRDGSCMMQPPTYLMTNEGAGRWAGDEEALVRVSPDTRVMWDVTMENLENIIMTINLSGESHKANQVYLLSLKATCKDLKRRKKSNLCFQKYHQGENATPIKLVKGRERKRLYSQFSYSRNLGLFPGRILRLIRHWALDWAVTRVLRV